MHNRFSVHLVRSLLIIGLFGLVEVRAVAGPLYAVTNLGNGGWSLLNNNGQVAGGGYTTNHSSSTYTQVYNGDAGGQVTVIGVTPPSSSGPGSYDFSSDPLSLNDSGQLILQGTPNAPVYELYSNGARTSLPLLSVAINNSGVLTGNDGYNLPGLASNQAYVQSGAVATQLGVLPGAEESLSVAINNSGQVTGNSFHMYVTNPNGSGVIDAPSNQAWTHAFLYNGSTMVDLGTLGSKESYAAAMNNHGAVVGMSGIVASLDAGDRNQVFHAFYVPLGGKMVDLGTLPGTNASGATGINDKGQIVGWSGLSSTITAFQGMALTSHAFLYQNGLMTDLNLLVPQNGVVLTKALAINNEGQILVDGIDSKGNDEQLLLTPVGQPVPGSPVYGEAAVPEPSTLLVLVFGAIAFATKWARKTA